MQALNRFVAAVILVALLVLVAAIAAAAEPYDRQKHFGGWLDMDGDGDDTRMEVVKGSHLRVIGFLDLYTGKWFARPEQGHVDHVVPLKWAWDHGADQWEHSRRQEFANDPGNLLFINASVNLSKGDRGPDEWMPPSVSMWRAYLDWWDTILHKYGLEYTPAEAKRVACLRRHLDDHELGIKIEKVRQLRRC